MKIAAIMMATAVSGTAVTGKLTPLPSGCPEQSVP